MPTYQYRCTQCGNELEVVQKFTDPVLTECESCHGALRKVYNAVGVVFKGSGFYRTDSRKAEGNGSSGGGKSAEKNGEKVSAASSGSDGSGSKSEGSGSKSEGSGSKSEGSGSETGKSSTTASSTAA